MYCKLYLICGISDYMKPDTETYNWVIQAYTRAESYDRLDDLNGCETSH